jgi:hypothetical protein
VTLQGTRATDCAYPQPRLKPVDESDYRLTADFHTEHDAGAVVELLEANPELSKDGASLSYYPGSKTLFLYAPTADVMERVVRVLRVGADTIGVRPVSVAAGQWLSDEERWSDDGDSGSAGDSSGSGVVSGVAGGIMDGWLAWLTW